MVNALESSQSYLDVANNLPDIQLVTAKQKMQS